MVKESYKLFGIEDFCRLAYAHVNQGKLELSLKFVLLGCPKGVKGYRLGYIDLKLPRCVISRDVVFIES